MWEARAEYADGTSVSRLFAYNDREGDDEQQYKLECWLIGRHEDCVWYTVNYISEEDF